MTTSQRFRATATGPVSFRGKLPYGTLMVRTEPGLQHPEIVVSTQDQTGPSADAVRKARFVERNGQVSVEVDMPDSGGGSVTIVNGMNFSGGVTMVNGRVISGSGAVQTGNSSIYIAALLPPNSSVEFDTVSAAVQIEGAAAHVSGKTMSGSVTVEVAASADCSTVSGRIDIRALGGDARLKSMSGSIDVCATTPCRVKAETMSGDVTVRGVRVELDGRSMSGRVRQF
ncbi:DUF4097 family beta strand repeat-containing protein [Micromonospora chalcea]|uniref:DUF4097 family beta strand repeat-containing protein n=1 Tax=Micromonospora chalcea TaxID=1874 RepID=UPI003D730DB5